MYETLAAGVADRTVTVSDLNIPDPPAGADPQTAARTDFGSAASEFLQSGTAPALSLTPSTGTSGVTPLQTTGAAAAPPSMGLMSSQVPLAVQPVVISQAGPEPSLVSQGADQETGRDALLVEPRASLVLDSVLAEVASGPSRFPSERGAGERGLIAPARRSISIPEAVRNDLSTDDVEPRGQPVGENSEPSVHGSDSDAPVTVNPTALQERSGECGGLLPRLAVSAIATGFWGYRTRYVGGRNLQARKWLNPREPLSSK
jgi:hypothetical protein